MTSSEEIAPPYQSELEQQYPSDDIETVPAAGSELSLRLRDRPWFVWLIGLAQGLLVLGLDALSLRLGAPRWFFWASAIGISTALFSIVAPLRLLYIAICAMIIEYFASLVQQSAYRASLGYDDALSGAQSVTFSPWVFVASIGVSCAGFAIATALSKNKRDHYVLSLGSAKTSAGAWIATGLIVVMALIPIGRAFTGNYDFQPPVARKDAVGFVGYPTLNEIQDMVTSGLSSADILGEVDCSYGYLRNAGSVDSQPGIYICTARSPYFGEPDHKLTIEWIAGMRFYCQDDSIGRRGSFC